VPPLESARGGIRSAEAEQSGTDDKRHDVDVVDSFLKHIANVIGCDSDACLVLVRRYVNRSPRRTTSTCAADR